MNQMRLSRYLLFVSVCIIPAFVVTYLVQPIFSSESQPTTKDENLVVTKVADNLDSPSGLSIIGNDILIAQKDDGKVKLIRNLDLKKYSILDINTFNNGIDNGLKGITSANLDNITYVFLMYSENIGNSDAATQSDEIDYHIYRYNWNSTGLELTNKTLILSLPTNEPVNIGGKMIVGPDNKLYVTIGDQNKRGKEQNIPQIGEFFSLFASNNIKSSAILRVNFDGSPAEGNPFSENGFGTYYAYGIRNSFGLAFDPISKYLWDTEQGPGSMDEVNLVLPGFNSGWMAIQGNANMSCCSDNVQLSQNLFKLFKVRGSYYSEPKVTFENSTGLTGIVFQNSDALGKQYKNAMFVADMKGNIFVFKLDENRENIVDVNTSDNIFAKGFGPISDLKLNSDGGLYVLTYSNSSDYPFGQNTGSLYSISGTNLTSHLNESAKITYEQIALLVTFLIILTIIVSLRFRLIYNNLKEFWSKIRH